MKRTEMMLAGGLLLVVVGWLVGPSLLDLVTGSGERLEARRLEASRREARRPGASRRGASRRGASSRGATSQ